MFSIARKIIRPQLFICEFGQSRILGLFALLTHFSRKRLSPNRKNFFFSKHFFSHFFSWSPFFTVFPVEIDQSQLRLYIRPVFGPFRGVLQKKYVMKFSYVNSPKVAFRGFPSTTRSADRDFH